MIKKLNIALVSIILILILSIQIVEATKSANINSDIKMSFDNFFANINEGNENVYNYIDTSNTELYNNVENYLHNLTIKYQIINVTTENDVYNIETKIAASGIGWNVSGFTVNFKLKQINNQYKIIETDLFDVIGIDNIFSIVFKIFVIIGGILLTIVLVVVIIVIHMKKKKE